MKKYITIAALLSVGTAFANAETDAHSACVYKDGAHVDQYSSSGRIENGAANLGYVTDEYTYVLKTSQMFLNSWTGSSRTPTTFAFNLELAGVGRANGVYEPETPFTLRLHEQSTLAGDLTISASTAIWSSGSAGVTSNVISGDVETTDMSSELTLDCDYRLDFTGSTVILSNVVLDGTLGFNSSDISISGITGTGAVIFSEGSKISLNVGQTLNIAVDSLTFGSTQVTESLSEDDLEAVVSDYFKGTEIASVSYSGGAFKVVAVPEPSAFGMLAGLGALALVASRRRRK